MTSRRVRAFGGVGLATIGLLLVCTGLTTPPGPTMLAGDPSPVTIARPTRPFAFDLRAPSAAEPTEDAERTDHPNHAERSEHPARTEHAERTDVRDDVIGPVLAESDPVAVSIPSIKVRSALVDLGLDASGEMEVPRDPAKAGWFSRGAAPGALGPAVIAGHVTWNGTPGVFYRLGTLRAGDRVSVTRTDGVTAVFVVTRVGRYFKAQFPKRSVYGPIDHAGLRLITCGGVYDSSRHAYEDNIVVFARLEAVRTGRG